jgi:hypothetical protein
LTTVEPDEQGKTARIEPPPATSPPDAAEPIGPEAAAVESPPTAFVPRPVEEPANVVLRPSSPNQEVVFVPLAVNIGDGFKFGCGFFLALVLAMLVGFVLIAALFVLTSLFGLNLPITR